MEKDGPLPTILWAYVSGRHTLQWHSCCSMLEVGAVASTPKLTRSDVGFAAPAQAAAACSCCRRLRLPLLLPQPREYKSKEAAGQMRRSPHQFTGIGSLSPTLWLARGYAVLDGPGFPIVAEGDEEPNDTYVEQLTASAEAAVKVRARVDQPCRGY